MTASGAEERNLWPECPDYRVELVTCPKRVRAVIDDATLVDTVNPRLMLETGHPPVYYFAGDDLVTQMLESSDHRTHCPFKGVARYWHITAGERVAHNAVWSYLAPYPEKPKSPACSRSIGQLRITGMKRTRRFLSIRVIRTSGLTFVSRRAHSVYG